MPQGVPNKKYTPEFKKLVVETMQEKHLGYCETAERFEIRHKRVQDWERIYLTEGPEGFSVERRGGGGERKPKEIARRGGGEGRGEGRRARGEEEDVRKQTADVE